MVLCVFVLLTRSTRFFFAIYFQRKKNFCVVRDLHTFARGAFTTPILAFSSCMHVCVGDCSVSLIESEHKIDGFEIKAKWRQNCFARRRMQWKSCLFCRVSYNRGVRSGCVPSFTVVYLGINIRKCAKIPDIEMSNRRVRDRCFFRSSRIFRFYHFANAGSDSDSINVLPRNLVYALSTPKPKSQGHMWKTDKTNLIIELENEIMESENYKQKRVYGLSVR